MTRPAQPEPLALGELLALSCGSLLALAGTAKLLNCRQLEMELLEWFGAGWLGRNGCALLICAEVTATITLLSGSRRHRMWLAGVLCTLCSLGNGILWLAAGDGDCGCLGGLGARRAWLCVGAGIVALLIATVGRRPTSIPASWRRHLLRAGLGGGVLLGLVAGAAHRTAPDWRAYVEPAASASAVVMIGSSTCETCRDVIRRGEVLLDGRPVRLQEIVLVVPEGDLLAGDPQQTRFRRLIAIPRSAWWSAVEGEAPAYYRRLTTGWQRMRSPHR